MQDLRIPADLERQLSELADELRRQTRVPGICIAVSVEGRPVAVASGTRVLGSPQPLTTQSRFHIGCIAKLLLSLVTLELARDGRLDLNAPMHEALPELRGTIHGRSVALVHLLSHTGGYRGTELLEPQCRHFTWDAFVGYLASRPQLFAPGTVFSYEHSSAVLAGEIVRRTAGRDAQALILETVLRPAGIEPGVLQGDQEAVPEQAGQHLPDMKRGCFVRTRWSAFYEHERLPFPSFWRDAFSLHMMSLPDLTALGDILSGASDSGFEAGGCGVSPATRSQLQRPVVQIHGVVDGQLTGLLPSAFSLGAAEFGGGWLGLGAMSLGQCVGLRFHAARQISVAVGVNAMVPNLRDLALEHVCAMLGGVAHGARHQPARFEFELPELAGTYLGSGGQRCEVRVEDERLVCELRCDGHARTARAELVVDDEGYPVVRCSVPTVSLGFFRDPADAGGMGMMLGLTAFKRSDPRAGA